MRKKRLFTSTGFADLKVLLLLVAFLFIVSDATKRLHITDYLNDVVDDEEDEGWREWGKKKTNSPPPPEVEFPPYFTEVTAEQIQAEMMKREFGPSVGFVKLRLGIKRSRVVSFFFCDKLDIPCLAFVLDFIFSTM